MKKFLLIATALLPLLTSCNDEKCPLKDSESVQYSWRSKGKNNKVYAEIVWQEGGVSGVTYYKLYANGVAEFSSDVIENGVKKREEKGIITGPHRFIYEKY